jgi:hypothetical protein
MDQDAAVKQGLGPAQAQLLGNLPRLLPLAGGLAGL